jgi:hypothetical protein
MLLLLAAAPPLAYPPHMNTVRRAVLLPAPETTPGDVTPRFSPDEEQRANMT